MKLHELLAVETALEGQSNKCRTDLAGTFEKKRHLFEEKRTTFQPNGEGQAPVIETQSDLQTTVGKELDWLFTTHLRKSLDASYQVAEANMHAKADVILEETTVPILLAVPATALLELEKRVAEIAELVKAVPTLDPAKGFQPDSTAKFPGAYKAREVTKTRTKKTAKVLVKYEATKEHPAQTEMVMEDIPVGTIQELEWSGLVTPADKAAMLNRVEMLGRAVRKARSRANEQAVDTGAQIGDKLLSFILKG